VSEAGSDATKLVKEVNIHGTGLKPNSWYTFNTTSSRSAKDEMEKGMDPSNLEKSGNRTDERPDLSRTQSVAASTADVSA
jgi:hypothetical protein